MYLRKNIRILHYLIYLTFKDVYNIEKEVTSENQHIVSMNIVQGFTYK